MLNIFFCIFIISFFLYEKKLNRYYKKDLEKEKLISFFSNTRIKLIKMLYTKEINCDSAYFNIMLMSTSYSIRTIYYNKKRLSLEQLSYLENLLDLYNDDKLKNEFENLNSEQKRLFAKTTIKLLELYFSTDFIRKLFWSMYILKTSSKIIKMFTNTFKNISNTSFTYLKNIETTYNISQYNYA